MKKLLLQSALLAAGFLLLAGCTNVATFDYSAAAEPMVSFAGPPEAKSIAVLPFLDQRSRKSLQQLAPAADSGSFYLGLLPLMPYGYVKKPFPERSDDFVSLGRFHFNPSLDLAEASVLSLKASRLFGRVELADSAGRTRIEIAGRASLLRLYRFLKKQPGLEKLEFKLNAAECGVRETRTIVGLETVTAEEYAAGKKYKDAVSHAFYPIDLHDAKVGLDKRNLAPGIVPTVPRGALIPRNTRHLLAAGRILSSDRLANSALRVQATCMATGQAAGALAALSVRLGVPAEEIPMPELRRLLEANRAIVP